MRTYVRTCNNYTFAKKCKLEITFGWC